VIAPEKNRGSKFWGFKKYQRGEKEWIKKFVKGY
jgi:hypothetical protein